MVSLLIYLGLFALATIPHSQCHRIPRHINQEKTAQPDDTTMSLRIISIVMGTFGTEIINRIAPVEQKIVNLYLSELKAKKECQWTEKDEGKWVTKLEGIKIQILNDTNLNDTFGLDAYRAMTNMTDNAKLIFSILEEMENFTESLITGEMSDFLILKFAGYLREQMVRRQAKFPACSWTESDTMSADEKIEKIIGDLATEVVDGLVGRLEEKPGDIFSDADKEDMKKGWSSVTTVFKTLFDPFDMD